MEMLAGVPSLRFSRDDDVRETGAPVASDETSPWRTPLRLSEAATLIGWILVVAVIAYSYLSGSTGGPYGTCYAPSGRGVPCELVRK